MQRQVYVTFGGTKKELNQTCLYSDDNMNTKKLECFDDDDSVDGKQSLSFLGKFFISSINVSSIYGCKQTGSLIASDIIMRR